MSLDHQLRYDVTIQRFADQRGPKTLRTHNKAIWACTPTVREKFSKTGNYLWWVKTSKGNFFYSLIDWFWNFVKLRLPPNHNYWFPLAELLLFDNAVKSKLLACLLLCSDVWWKLLTKIKGEKRAIMCFINCVKG